MSRTGIIFAYFFGSCAIGCLAAYPASLIIDIEFSKIVSRGILILAVLLFYPAYRLLNIKNPEYLGFPPHNKCNTLFIAWIIGVAILIPLTFYFLLCGYREWEPVFLAGYTGPLTTIASAIVSGLIIALIEETLFRGLLQSELTRALNSLLAIILVSFLYASVHFLEAPEVSSVETVGWSSGFKVFFSSFTQLSQPIYIWDSWLALFAAGVFLSVIRLRSRNLIWCIGIHAGWVAHIKVIKAFTDRNVDASCGVMTGTYDKYIGELSTIWLVILLIVWLVIDIRRKKTSG